MYDGNSLNLARSADQRSAPLALVSQDPANRTRVWIGHVCVGGDSAVVMAGPCSVETEDQVVATALAVKACGASILRGGAYKPRTSPYDFQGLGEAGLRLLRLAGDEAQMPIVTEVMSEYDVDLVAEYADLIQIGARNMQNFALLRRLARKDKPLLLKRGASATVNEWLSAAEYLLEGGNANVILCERGIKTFDHSLRNTLDLAAVALAKELTHLPIIVDPSHATGKRSLIAVSARAALAIGADGVIVEVHPHPEQAWSDGAQSLNFLEFAELMKRLGEPIKSAVAPVPQTAFA